MSFIPYKRTQVRANIQVKGTSHGPHEFNCREGYRRPRAVLLRPWGEEGGEANALHRHWRTTDLTQTDELLVQETVWLDRAPAGELFALLRVVGLFRPDELMDAGQDEEEVDVSFTLRTQQLVGAAWTTITTETVDQTIRLYPMRYHTASRILRFGADVHIGGNYDFANSETARAPISFEGQLTPRDLELLNSVQLAVGLAGVAAGPVRVQVLTTGDPALSILGRAHPGALCAGCSLYWRGT